MDEGLPGGLIDARKYHDPALAPGLVVAAISLCGTQAEVAARCGVTRDYLRKIRSGERTMSYTLQVTLEKLASGD